MEYPKEISCANVERVFADAAEFVVRPIKMGDVTATAFFIDGLTSGSEIAVLLCQCDGRFKGFGCSGSKKADAFFFKDIVARPFGGGQSVPRLNVHYKYGFSWCCTGASSYL